MDPETLRAIAAKMREHNTPPHGGMLIADYYVAVALYAFIEGMEAVADDARL